MRLRGGDGGPGYALPLSGGRRLPTALRLVAPEIHCVSPVGAWIRHRCFTGGGAVRLASKRHGGAQPLRWRIEGAPGASLDAARRVRHARQRVREATEALAAMDVGEAE